MCAFHQYECIEVYCEGMLLHLACVITVDVVRLSPLYLAYVVIVDGVSLSPLYLACVVTVDGVRLSPLYLVTRVVGTLPLEYFHTDGTHTCIRIFGTLPPSPWEQLD